MSSIASTTAWGVGTHTTSLPAWPTCGSNGFWPVVACANATLAVNVSATRERIARRVFIDFSINFFLRLLRP